MNEAAWFESERNEGGFYEYCWVGSIEQVSDLVEDLEGQEGVYIARVWRGVLVEGYPEAAIILLRSQQPLGRPEWALRVTRPLALATVGVFAGP